MRIITCAGYYGTGSSAITDLLSEYNTCKSLGEYEFRFIQDPEGIADLEYNLVENHHRHNSGHALKRYKNKVDFLAGNKIIKKYELFFNNRWKEFSYDYIEELIDIKYAGYWHQDVIDKGNVFYLRKRLINKLLQKTLWKNRGWHNINEMPKEYTLCSSPSEEKFLRCTRKYIDRLFNEANIENKPNVIVDQLVPPSNIQRYLRYFGDIKVFVVDRDPRDIYVLEKYIWKGKVVPTETVQLFCEWFEYTRKHRKNEIYQKDKVMFIKFEDLIYKYEDTITKIEAWSGVGSDNHEYYKSFFDPEKSINNTKCWTKVNCNMEEILYIEDRLKEYLYQYDIS